MSNMVELLRKVRLFNKSRYSRNRQLSRVIFIFSLLINIFIIYGIYYIIYNINIFTGGLYLACYMSSLGFFISCYLRYLNY